MKTFLLLVFTFLQALQVSASKSKIVPCPAIVYLNTTGSRHSHGNWSGQVDVPVLIITLVSIAVFVCCVLPLCWYFCGEGKKLEYRRPVVYDTHCDDECY